MPGISCASETLCSMKSCNASKHLFTNLNRYNIMSDNSHIALGAKLDNSSHITLGAKLDNLIQFN